MLGAKAASADKSGKTEPLWDIMDRMSKPGKAVYPTGDEHEKSLLKVKYKVFLEQCHSQQAYRKEVDEVVGKWDEEKAGGEQVDGVKERNGEKAVDGVTAMNGEKAVDGVTAMSGEKAVDGEKAGGGIAMKLPLG